jgi:ribosomal protein S27AE
LDEYRLVKLGDDVGDRLADAGDLLETVFGDEHVQRDREGGQTVGRAGIRLRTVGIAAAQRAALRVFAQQSCDLLRTDLGHRFSYRSLNSNVVARFRKAWPGTRGKRASCQETLGDVRMIETETLLEKCPRCGAWPMAAYVQRTSSPQPGVRFRCQRCHADEEGRLRGLPIHRGQAHDLNAA